MKNRQLHQSLRLRQQSTTTLAAAIQSCRTQVCQVLNNTPGRGHVTRKKLAPLLTHSERELAGWNLDGTLKIAAQPKP